MQNFIIATWAVVVFNILLKVIILLLMVLRVPPPNIHIGIAILIYFILIVSVWISVYKLV